MSGIVCPRCWRVLGDYRYLNCDAAECPGKAPTGFKPMESRRAFDSYPPQQAVVRPLPDCSDCDHVLGCHMNCSPRGTTK